MIAGLGSMVLIGQRAPVGAHLARRGIDAGVAVHAMLDALIVPEPDIGLAQRPADFGEFSAGCLGPPAFEAQHLVAAAVGRILPHPFGRTLVMTARRDAGNLTFQPLVKMARTRAWERGVQIVVLSVVHEYN